eukprot:TRINITY_DN4688_c0_g1_i1.p1 TRINITY_DN4688_c0_g1~~TRINITY_DN4688_c0_g1_i1.p1  ORF type:complete len:736 (-),score=154.11 TRINITY_DN4688_c0_g1_i1:308-2515(-)
MDQHLEGPYIDTSHDLVNHVMDPRSSMHDQDMNMVLNSQETLNNMQMNSQNEEILIDEQISMNPHTLIDTNLNIENSESLENQNIIDPDNRACAGFEENIVLAVKECFFEEEIRCILIKRTGNEKRVKYFARNCTNFASDKRVCNECDRWFTHLSGLPLMDSSLKADIGHFLDVKLDESYKETVKHESKVKEEDEIESNEDWSPDMPEKRGPGRPRKKKRKIPAENRVPGGFICRIEGCSKVFPKRKGWLKHDKTHEAKKPCDICGLEVSKLAEHTRRCHEYPGSDWDEDSKDWQIGSVKVRKRKYSEDRADNGDYICRFDDCNKMFDRKKVYLKHIYLIHEGGNEKRKRKKVCEHCGALITANNMKQHVRTVHTHKHEKNFACEHCGKEFKYRSELTVHLTHHTGELNFSCSGCAKKFRRAAEARLCEKGHRGIYNFSCNICDYKTHKKHHLDRHMKSHLKSTPFACPICGFKSGRKDNLKQHVEKRHCSSNTSIKQLEDQYPDMYKLHESCEAAEMAKNEAIAAHKEKMSQETKYSDNVSSAGTILSNMLLPEQDHSLVMVGQSSEVSMSDNMNKYMIEQQMEKKYIPETQNTNHEVKFITEQHESKYIPNDHERLMQEQQQRLAMEQNERYVQDQRDRMLHEQREREHILMQEQRDRYANEQRERMIAEQRERERIIQEQREREQQRLLAEQRERDRLALDMRERMFPEQRERIASNSLAEVYQRMRSLNQQ